jgi:hypothetical protein
LVEQWRNHPARRTPRSPTIKQYGARILLVQNVARETRVRHRLRFQTRASLSARFRLSIQLRAALATHRLSATRRPFIYPILRPALRARLNIHLLFPFDIKAQKYLMREASAT